MTTLTYAVSDTTTMLRRNLKHMARYPSLTFLVVAIPVVILLLFVYVFGGALGAGVGSAGGAGGGTPGGGSRADYVDYVVPGILLLAIAGSAQGTAIGVAMDMTEGIIARFRSMSISRAAVLAGHVIGSTLQTMIGLAVVVGIALLIGFRPTATAVEWLAAAGLLALVTVGVSWLCVALGLSATSVETASNTPMPLILLPFLGSGFVPTDSMPAAMRWFADNQPFTPVIEAVRGLLLGTPVGSSGVVALAWALVLSVIGYLWARAAYERRPAR